MAEKISQDCILVLDHGSSGCKVGLTDDRGEVIDFTYEPTETIYMAGGGAEQDPEEWWMAFVKGSRRIIGRNRGAEERVAAVSVSSTGSTTVAVDKEGNPVMNALTWADSRSAPYVKETVGGLFSVGGYSLGKLLKWIRLTNGAPSLSGKDDAGHMLLIKHFFPRLYEKTHKFLSSKDYFNSRLTGNFNASYDSIALFWAADIRNINSIKYSNSAINLLGIDREKLPDLIPPGETAGTITPRASEELGLPKGIKIALGGQDLQSCLLGSGMVKDYQAHCYIGTGSWVQCLTPEKKSDVFKAMASLPSSIPGRYQCINAQEIAGGCLTHLIKNVVRCFNCDPGDLDMTGEYMDKEYEIFNDVASRVPPGARGVIYTPWLVGEMSPVDNHYIRGGLYNLSMHNTINDITRAVYEGVAFNTRWLTEAAEGFVKRNFPEIAMVGGGAESNLWCQIFADVMDKPIKQMDQPIQSNIRGAAFIALNALGKIEWTDIPDLVSCRRIFEPVQENRRLYEDLYGTFLEIYRKNRGIYKRLNRRILSEGSG